MEHFDDMLRNTIANDYPENRFEFREEYWLQAQALIESYERKRKRRAIFWITAGLLLSIAAVCYFYNGSQPEETTPDAQPALQQTPEQSMADVQVPPATISGANQPVLHPLAANNNEDEYDTSLSAETETNQIQQKNNAVNQRTQNYNTESNTSAATAHGSSQKAALQTPQPGLQPDADSFSPELPGAANSTAAPGREHVQTVRTIESVAFQFVNSESINQLPELVKLPPASGDVNSKGSSITKRAQKNRWHTGFTAFAGNSGKTIGKENLSFGLGIANQFKINQKWSLNADLLWRRYNTPSSSSLSNLPVNSNMDGYFLEEQVTTYSFGYQQTRTTTQIKAVHFAELPVYVGRHFRKWSADAGVMITTPILAKTHSERNESGTLNKIEMITDEASAYQLNIDQLWGSIIPGLVAGINFEPFRNLNMGLRGTYNLTKNDYTLSFSGERTDPLILNRSLSPFTADLRVKWLF